VGAGVTLPRGQGGAQPPDHYLKTHKQEPQNFPKSTQSLSRFLKNKNTTNSRHPEGIRREFVTCQKKAFLPEGGLFVLARNISCKYFFILELGIGLWVDWLFICR